MAMILDRSALGLSYIFQAFLFPSLAWHLARMRVAKQRNLYHELTTMRLEVELFEQRVATTRKLEQRCAQALYNAETNTSKRPIVLAFRSAIKKLEQDFQLDPELDPRLRSHAQSEHEPPAP